MKMQKERINFYTLLIAGSEDNSAGLITDETFGYTWPGPRVEGRRRRSATAAGGGIRALIDDGLGAHHLHDHGVPTGARFKIFHLYKHWFPLRRRRCGCPRRIWFRRRSHNANDRTLTLICTIDPMSLAYIGFWVGPLNGEIDTVVLQTFRNSFLFIKFKIMKIYS